MEGPGGRFQFPWFTGLVPEPCEKDFIELAPGEAFATLINVSRATRPNGPNDKYSFGELEGTYTDTVSHGSLRSNTLQITIGGQ
jgi:hypothetical protein